MPLTIAPRRPPVPGTRVAVIGDSIAANAYTAPSGTTLAQENGYGYISWAKAHSQGRFNISVNAAASGALAVGSSGNVVQAQVASALASSPHVVIDHSGINDVLAGTAPATVVTAKRAIWRQFADAGIKVFAPSVLPVNQALASMTAAKSQNMARFNHLLQEACAVSGDATFKDLYSGFVNPTNANGDAKTSYLYDNLHPSILGAYYAGKTLGTDAQFLAALQPYPLKSSLIDDWASSTANNVWIAGGFMSGSGGTAGTGVTGTIPATWEVSRSAGTPTAVCEVNARADGFGNTLDVAITAGANNDAIQILSANAPTHAAINDVIYAEAEIEMSSITNLRSIRTAVLVQVDSVNLFAYFGKGGSESTAQDAGLPAETATFVVKTPLFIANNAALNGAAITGLRLIIAADFKGAGGATLKISRVRGVKVV